MKNLILVSSLALAMFAMFIGAASAADKSPCADEAHYPLISKTDLKAVAGQDNVFIVDVNSAESFQKAHVPGAIHYESHVKNFAQMLPAQKDEMIVAYCGGVQCTAWLKAAKIACKNGYTNIRHFKEGITGWVANN